MIELIPASPAHVGIIANRMRHWDRVECKAHGHSPKQALRLGLVASTDVMTAKLNGRPEAMMGLTVTNALAGEGSPWFLGTEAVYDNPRAMLRFAPKVLGLWRDSTPHAFENRVAVGNARAIRMLRRWGFAVGDEVQMIGGVPFVSFRMEG
jgi:hypothetical protein